MNEEETQQQASSPSAARVRAMISLLQGKGIFTQEDLERAIADMDGRTPAQGAKVVARAWMDADFKGRLLQDADAALQEMGIDTRGFPPIAAVENTEEVHNLVVCTLCSCYPRSLLGLPPAWYKSLEYRSRAVVEPREVLREFGVELEDGVKVNVLDSSANMRYLVIPQRPPGTEELDETQLARLVSRDSMIGTARP